MSAPLRVVDTSAEDDVIAQAIDIIKGNWDDVDAFLAREALRRHLVGHAENGRCDRSPTGACPAWQVAHLIVIAFPELMN